MPVRTLLFLYRVCVRECMQKTAHMCVHEDIDMLSLFFLRQLRLLFSKPNPEECWNGSGGTEPSYLRLTKFNKGTAELEKEPVFFLLMVKPLPLIRNFQSLQMAK